MVYTPSKPLTLANFLANYGDDPRYELIDGELFDLEPTGPHEEVAAFIARKLNVQIDRLNLPWFIPSLCLIRPLGPTTAFRPDVVVLDRRELAKQPLWKTEPIITLGSSIRLVAEVVSSNWQNDYARKVNDYAELGILEYWIADYAALGGNQFLGYPKQPTLSICCLQDRVYDAIQLRGPEPIVSPTFPDLQITAHDVLQAWEAHDHG